MKLLGHGVRDVLMELHTDYRAMTTLFLLNGVLGCQPVPRIVRAAGYRVLGVQTRTSNIFCGLTLGGPTHNLSIGRGTFINRDCFIEAVAPVAIGADCQLGPQVCVLTSDHPRVPGAPAGRTVRPRPVTIGDRAWIGARALILPGVTVGPDVVVAAGSVVPHDCLAPGLYAGVPARPTAVRSAVDSEPASTAGRA